MSRRRLREDDGAVLVLALLFITAIALLTTSVLARTTAATGKTAVERQFLTKRYAAEAGLEYAVQQIRQRPNLCPSSATVNGDLLTPDDLLGSALPVNNPEQPLQVDCEVTSLNDIGFGGYGLITRDPSAAGLQVIGAASTELKINGPVFLSDLDDPLKFDVTDGDLLVRHDPATCPSAESLDVTLNSPHVLACVTTEAPDPVPTLPDMAMTNRGADPAGGNSHSKYDCSAWQPGRYTSINLDTNNYFASGVYYFEDVDLMLSKGSITGGMPDDDNGETKTTQASCKKANGDQVTDADVNGAGSSNGTGVKFILGGSSRIIADNPKGVIELFARQAPSDAVAAAEGTQRVSVMTVKSTTTRSGVTYTRSAHDFTSVVFGVANDSSGGGGSTLEMVVHGGVYAGDGLVQVRNNKANTQFRGGLVAGRLEISTSANVDGFNIGIRTTPQPRIIRITSVAGPETERRVTATATARMDNQTGDVELLTRSVED